MPVIGWGSAKVLQSHSPVAFSAIMGGHASPNFIVKMAMVFFLAVFGITYLFARYESRLLHGGLTAGVVSVAGFFWVHPTLTFAGGAAGWRVLHTLVPILFIAFCWFVARKWDHTARVWRRIMFIAGMAAFVSFLIGGFIKSKARQPYTVYKEILKPESTPGEEARFLLHERCLYCHPGAKGFDAHGEKDWDSLVQAERDRPGVELTDDEARQLVEYLKEQYP